MNMDFRNRQAIELSQNHVQWRAVENSVSSVTVVLQKQMMQVSLQLL